MNEELIKVAEKAANSWRNTDAYHQAATIIDMLVDEVKRLDKIRIEYSWEKYPDRMGRF